MGRKKPPCPNQRKYPSTSNVSWSKVVGTPMHMEGMVTRTATTMEEVTGLGIILVFSQRHRGTIFAFARTRNNTTE
eukprot:m.166019 g.166019  ORF g.166019 m.166019 type:complete len:76 (+) comp24997_c1_seq3:1184-1411(+)